MEGRFSQTWHALRAFFISPNGKGGLGGWEGTMVNATI